MAVYDVARFEDLPEGRGVVALAGDRPVALFRVGSRVFALDNVCRHNGGPLGEGDVEGDCAVCPWHGWRYDLATGASPVNPLVAVATYEAWIDDGAVKVRIG